MKRWGGDWTKEKLARLQKYIEFYLTALKNKTFRKIYIDAFAGSGYISYDRASRDFFGEELDEATSFLKGSPRIALEASIKGKVKPFDAYYFIEKDKKKLDELKKNLSDILEPHPELKAEFIHGEANEWLRDFADRLGKFDRALVFLDPYGCQVKWDTLEALAKTRKVDLFLLFPVGLAVTRLMKKRVRDIDDIPAAVQKTLTGIFGTDAWKDTLYKSQPTLFGEEQVRDNWSAILNFFVNRLKEIFVDVEYMILMNSKHNPIYALIYACSNEKGCRLAMKAVRKYLFNPRRRKAYKVE